MRVLLESDWPSAAAAVEQYCYAIQRHLGSLAAALEGLDALVFTGGVGENAAVIRGRVCERLGWLGLTLDPAANDANATRIGAPGAAVTAWVIPTDEERVIARHTQGLLGL
jgi:acetate kinase